MWLANSFALAVVVAAADVDVGVFVIFSSRLVDSVCGAEDGTVCALLLAVCLSVYLSSAVSFFLACFLTTR